MKLRTLLKEIIAEAAFGKKFPIQMTRDGQIRNFIGIASANAKPDERKYRITWFIHDLSQNRHVDLTLDEMISILENKEFPPEIIQRIKTMWPDSELIGDRYTIKT